MNTKQRMTVVLVLALSWIVSGCAPGQIFGPTVTPTPTSTPNTACTRLVGMCRQNGFTLGSKLVPSKRLHLVPPTSE